MTITLIIIGYLVGCVVAYIAFKRDIKSIGGIWTKGDRICGIFISIFSWLNIVSIISVAGKHWFNDNTPASW